MTIVVGLAPGKKGLSALHLAAVMARSRVEDLLVCTIVKAPWPPDPNYADREYLAYQEKALQASLEHAREYLGADPIHAEFVVRRATSVAAGLVTLIGEREVSLAILGSSSSGVLGHVMLGAVSERIVHGADVPVAVAPRGYRGGPTTQLSRVSVAFGRADHDSGLLKRALVGAREFSSPLRVVCFAVRPMAVSSEAIESAAEQAVVNKWQQRLESDVAATVAGVESVDPGARSVATRLEVVMGEGGTWGAAISDVEWSSADLLVVGTSSGPFSRFFMGSHALKIVRNSPVPVLLLPRD